MKFPHFLYKAFWMPLIFAAGCNIFDPADEATVKTGNSAALISEGERLHRDGEYARAAALFERAIDKDSTLSEAYFGLSKANLYANRGNPYALLRHFNSDATIPLMDLDLGEVEQYAKALRESLIPLRELVRRDTLTANDPTRKLSDRRVTYQNFSASYAILEFAYTILEFRRSAGTSIGISIRSDGSVEVDLAELYEKALSDSAEAANLNAAIDTLQKNLQQSLENVLPSVSKTLENSLFDADDSTDISEIIGENLEENASTVENSILFYKLGDGTDNDGDGCVDEEILDGKDNDGDGFIDEDLRLVPLVRDADSAVIFIGVGTDSLDHDRNGQLEDMPERTLSENGTLLFAAEFPKISWAETSENSIQRQIAGDTDSTNIRYPLEERKRLVGRCWNNYTEDDFKAWFRNR